MDSVYEPKKDKNLYSVFEPKNNENMYSVDKCKIKCKILLWNPDSKTKEYCYVFTKNMKKEGMLLHASLLLFILLLHPMFAKFLDALADTSN